MEESQLERDPRNGFLALVLRPIHWLKMLGEELHWSFVLGVMIVYGVSQGFAVGMSKVSTKYYMKDEQKVQPSELQVYLGLLQLPWVMKPLWGLLTAAGSNVEEEEFEGKGKECTLVPERKKMTGERGFANLLYFLSTLCH